MLIVVVPSGMCSSTRIDVEGRVAGSERSQGPVGRDLQRRCLIAQLDHVEYSYLLKMAVISEQQECNEQVVKKETLQKAIFACRLIGQLDTLVRSLRTLSQRLASLCAG